MRGKHVGRTPETPAPPSPYPAEEAVPVGGFLITIALENAPALCTDRNGMKNLPVYEVYDKPVNIIVNVQNTTERVLSYTIRSFPQQYQVDVRGGECDDNYGRPRKIKEILSVQAPLTAYAARVYRRSILPLTPPASGNWYSPFGSQQGREIPPGEAEVFRIAVDYLYDLSLTGLYRISVRCLFAVRPWAEMSEEDRNKRGGGLSSNYEVPGLCEAAVSNTIDVYVGRSAFDFDFQRSGPPPDSSARS